MLCYVVMCEQRGGNGDEENKPGQQASHRNMRQ